MAVDWLAPWTVSSMMVLPVTQTPLEHTLFMSMMTVSTVPPEPVEISALKVIDPVTGFGLPCVSHARSTDPEVPFTDAHLLFWTFAPPTAEKTGLAAAIDP